MMVGDDDPNVFDLVYGDPGLEQQHNRAHLQTVLNILQNNPEAFTPRVQNSCTGVHRAIKYDGEGLDQLFRDLEVGLEALNPGLF